MQNLKTEKVNQKIFWKTKNKKQWGKEIKRNPK